MDFRAHVESFEEANRQYAELARRLDAGEIGREEFEERRQQLMVRDEEGNWWAKLGESGEWHRRDGGDWVRDFPPGDRKAAEDSGSQAKHAPPGGPVEERSGRRRLPLWIPLAALIGLALLVAAVVLYAPIPALQTPPPSSSGGAGGGGGGADGAVFEEVFVHRATPENISANSTYIDNPLTNGNPDAVLIVTQSWNPGGEGGTYNDHSIGVWYDAERERWAIFNQDREEMTGEAAFNVAVSERTE